MIPFIRPYFDEDDLEAVKQVMQSGWVAQGPKVEEFEEAICKYLGCKHAVTVTNCTLALYLSLLACGIGEGDEVIIPDYTFPATGLAVLRAGATPILVDVDPVTYNIQPSAIEEAITEHTAAIIPVHLFGRSAEMYQVMAIAEDHCLSVIEDAACSLGTFFDTQRVGTFGEIGCFSLHASKGITTGEGGICVTNNALHAENIRRLSCFGDERTYRRGKKWRPFNYDPMALNYKMSDITAAIGLSQLKKIDKLIDWRIRVAAQWDDVIKSDAVLKDSLLPPELLINSHEHIYQSYVCNVVKGDRQQLVNYFHSKGFATGIGTHACHMYLDTFPEVRHSLVNSHHLFHNTISLPRYYGLDVFEEWYK